MIEETDQIKAQLKAFFEEAEVILLQTAWDACCDGDEVAKCLEDDEDEDIDPWDGEHEDMRRRIESDILYGVLCSTKKRL